MVISRFFACILFLVCTVSSDAFPETCPPETLVTLQTANNKPILIKHMSGTNTQYNKSFITLNVTFPNVNSSISNLKATGGVQTYERYYPIQHGSCYQAITSSPNGWSFKPDPLSFSCQLLFEANPIAGGDLTHVGIYKGTISVSYDYYYYLGPPNSSTPCTGSATKKVDAVVEVYKKPESSQPAPVVIPDVKMKLYDLKPNPQITQVGKANATWFKISTDPSYDQSSEAYKNLHNNFDIWTGIRLEPTTDADNFVLDPVADGFVAAGIGVAGTDTVGRKYSPAGNVGLKFNFKPKKEKLFNMKLVLTWRTCFKNDYVKCGPKQTFTLPFQADSRTEKNRKLRTVGGALKDKNLVPAAPPKPQ